MMVRHFVYPTTIAPEHDTSDELVDHASLLPVVGRKSSTWVASRISSTLDKGRVQDIEALCFGGGASDQRLRLRIGDDRTDEFSSKFEYRVKKGLARIKGTAKLWLPGGAGTGLDAATAPDALITATFIRGAAYAECEFTFDRIVDGRIAEYVFTSRQTGKASSPRLRVQKGSCDIDLGTAGLQAGIPGALANDTVEIVFHDEANSGHIDLGAGALEAK